MAKGTFELFGEVRYTSVRDSDILDDVQIHQATHVKGMMHDTGKHEVVQNPPSETIVWRDGIIEGISANPESTTVIAKGIILKRNNFSR